MPADPHTLPPGSHPRQIGVRTDPDSGAVRKVMECNLVADCPQPAEVCWNYTGGDGNTVMVYACHAHLPEGIQHDPASPAHQEG